MPGASGTANTVRPSKFADFGIAFLIVDQVLDVEHYLALFIFRYVLSLWFCLSFRKLSQLLGVFIELIFYVLVFQDLTVH